MAKYQSNCRLFVVWLLATLLPTNWLAAAQDDDSSAGLASIPRLSLSEFSLMIRQSDVHKEFGYEDDQGDEAERLFEIATLFEWNKARQRLNGLYPFLLCRNTTESGYVVKQILQQHLQEMSNSSTVSFKTVVNNKDFYCALARMNAVTAIAIGQRQDEWTIQPFLSAMKIFPFSVEEFEETNGDEVDQGERRAQEDDSTTTIFPSIDVVLCPNVLADDQATAFTSDTLLSNTTLRDELRWWRRQDGTNVDAAPRSEFWQNMLEGLESGVCNDTFQNRLEWSYFPSSDDNQEDVLHVSFANTDVDLIDKYCGMAVVAALSVNPAVCTIQTRRNPQTSNTNAQFLVQTGIENERPWFDAGIMGAGQVVAVSDTGIDTESCYFADPDVPVPFDDRNDLHRKIVSYDTHIDSVDQLYGHGTHVVGTVCASRDQDDPTAGMVPGMAPEAKVAFLDIGAPSGALVTPRNDFDICETGRTAEPKASIHSASWGLVGVPSYTIQTRNFDNYMFQNDDFLMIIAAGNDGDDNTAFTISSPATNKNGLAIGASHSCCDQLETGQLGPDHVASFSSRGPTADGRTKPDVLAPGKWILSVGARPDEPGSCDPDKTPGAGENGGGVLSLQGTSMSTPVTAGSAALIRQYFADGFYPTGEKVPANARNVTGNLVKAVIMNGAQYLSSVDDGGFKGTTSVYPYDNTQNFGRISFIDSLYLFGKSNIQAEVWDRQSVSDGQVATYEVTIDKSNGCESSMFSATLTWMEAGSLPGCVDCLLNNLDLSVTRQGDDSKVHHPNGRSLPDTTNNAERVQIENVQDGDVFIIRVEGANLLEESQQFALVATGCFGGIGTILDTNKNVFLNDNSQKTRKQKIIIGVTCTILGVFILFALAWYFGRWGCSLDGLRWRYDGNGVPDKELQRVEAY